MKRVLSLTRGRTEFTYYPGMVRVPQGSAPDFKNKSYRITADVEIPDDGAEGVFADAGWAIQWPWAIPRFRVNLSSTTTSWYYNLVGVDRTSVSSYDKLPPGKHSIVLTFKYDGGGIGKGGRATLSARQSGGR